MTSDPSNDPTIRTGEDPAAAVFEHPERIGPYKILQVIGEGGMGVVYDAEQTAPVQRRVALKMMKVGMDTKEVVARFEAERQALAMMDHPNIAKVLDAGASDKGRPFFVMERVQGVPLTEYCDTNQLSTKARLELFIPICQAVQHAHQKGIIHRDLKPSNVLVTIREGTPSPKIIDFGIAKAIGQRLTEKTLVTAYGMAMGTPAYMSRATSIVSRNVAAYLSAESRDSVVEAGAWNTLCWLGSRLVGAASEALSACDRGVAVSGGSIGIRDSRGIARALTGDFSGAIDDFNAFVNSDPEHRHANTRRTWIAELEAGRNPFTEARIMQLLWVQ